MTIPELTQKKCLPCEGGIPKLSPSEAQEFLSKVPDWKLVDDGTRIRREWVVKNFDAAMEFFQKVATVANSEGHHPDLHLVGFRNVAIEIWTHAVGGLTENDFILAAKIDEQPIQLKA